jgi:DNA-3-methyladenine glycosylase I
MITEQTALNGYCAAVAGMEQESLHRIYHDSHYGFPLKDDHELFGRLVLEINQAGLSWSTILKKEENFRRAFHQWNIKKIAAYDESERARLLADAGIIRNRLKVDAVIHNAGVVLAIQDEHGSFYDWLYKHRGLSKPEWVRLFKQTFRFTGGEIVNEFLMSIGFLPGAHDERCEIHRRILRKKPVWASQKP